MPRGVRTPQTGWEFYLDILNQVKGLYAKRFLTEPALASECKMCEWYTDCKKQMVSSNDVTLISELGRSKKDSLKVVAKTTKDLANMDVKDFLIAKKKLGIKGIAEDSFIKFNRRARLLISRQKEPFILGQISFPKSPLNFFLILKRTQLKILFICMELLREEKAKRIEVPFFCY